MKAIVQERYGPPEVLRPAELDQPGPGKDQVLVRVTRHLLWSQPPDRGPAR